MYRRFTRVTGPRTGWAAGRLTTGKSPELTRMQSHKFLIPIKILYELLTIGVTS